MVVPYLKTKKGGDVYGTVKKIIDDAISVSPWVTEDILKCAEIRHKQRICNNKLLDKVEAKTDKSGHQTSVLCLISNTTVNGERPKGSTK